MSPFKGNLGFSREAQGDPGASAGRPQERLEPLEAPRVAAHPSWAPVVVFPYVTAYSYLCIYVELLHHILL